MLIPNRGGIRHVRVNIHLTHPTLYWQTMIFALMSVGLALSYWFGPAPTFNPYDIDRDLVAWIFAVYGVWQIVFLNIHYLLMVRVGMAFAVVLMGAWGWANTFQSFAGKASFAFPIVFGAVAASHLKLLTESPVNPATQKASKP